MALVGNMIASALGGNPSIVNYSMFVAVLSMLSLVYQIAALHSESFVVMSAIPVVVDGLNTLFFLAGGIALAAYLQVHSCTDAVSLHRPPFQGFGEILWKGADECQSYVNSNIVTSGSNDNTKRCREGQAVCAFMWFGFAAWLGSLVFSAFGGSGSTVNLRGGIGGIRRGGAPSMTQV